MVFNGSIYNNPALRGQLRGIGHSFESRDDTEVILKTYAEWGQNCAAILRLSWSSLATLQYYLYTVLISTQIKLVGTLVTDPDQITARIQYATTYRGIRTGDRRSIY